MSAKRKTNSKKRGHINLSILLIIIALIAILSYAISYLFINNTSSNDVVTNQRHRPKIEKINKGLALINSPIDGSWYSTNDGTMLTIKGTTFIMESASVDESKTIKGTILLKGSEIIIMNDSSSKMCVNKPGKYSWKIENNETLTFIKINDPCSGRVNRMTGGWEKF